MKARRLSLFFFFLFVTYGAFLPFFPTWLDARGVRGVQMSALMAMGPALGVIGPPGFGALSDWLGLRGGLLRIVTAGGMISMLLLAIPTALGHAPGAALLASAMLLFSTSRTPAVAMADVMASEASKPENNAGAARSYGSVRLWGSIGFLIAALAVGRALDIRDPLLLPAFLAVSGGVTFALSFTLDAAAPTRARHIGASLGKVVRHRAFVWLLVSAFLGFGAHVSYDICFSLHLESLGVAASGVGAAWAIGVVAEVVLMAFSGRLIARFSASSLLVAAFLGGALRWILIANVTNVTALLILQPLHALSFAVFWVTSLDLVKRLAPPDVLATAQGLFNAAVGGGAVAFMFVWGALFEARGGRVTFTCAAGVAVCAAFAAFAIGRSPIRAPSRDLV